MAAALFRFVGGAARNMIVANVFGSFMLLIFMVLGGFILARGKTSSLYYVVLLIVAFFSNSGFHVCTGRESEEMVDLGLLDLPDDVCTECHLSE